MKYLPYFNALRAEAITRILVVHVIAVSGYFRCTKFHERDSCNRCSCLPLKTTIGCRR